MQSSEFEQLSDDSGAGDDPHQSSAVPNSLLQLQGDYETGSDSVIACSLSWLATSAAVHPIVAPALMR